jgi:hypothetical protein
MGLFGQPLSKTKFPPPRDYSSLSVRDCLDARDAYHVHLAHLDNVIATAIGRYRIRRGDRYDVCAPGDPRAKDLPKATGERTLFNSVIKPWSWPCVLVFVKQWLEKKDFSDNPDQAVPGALFLPDGRVIPTCVVRAVEVDAPADGEPSLSFPKSFIGGGYLVSSDVQGREHFGSIGCLVTDGTATYAITNRHVTGEAGRDIYAYLRGRREHVGVSHGKQIGKKVFTEVFPGWAGSYAVTNVDAGLIRVDDVTRWTSKVVSLPPLGLPIDLNVDTMTLDLIGCEVSAFGGMSGELHGRIEALFYRYKSIGGIDYVADLLIAPTTERNTLPGDSGTMWCLEQKPDCDPDTGLQRDVKERTAYRPIALQWGGHAIVDNGGEKTTARGFALATCVSTICRELDLDIIRDFNAQLPEYWGDVGHYTIGARACDEVTTPNLKKLMRANRTNVSYRDKDLDQDKFTFDEGDFVPLADVPDKVWKGQGWHANRGPGEHPLHHADMDQTFKKGKYKGKTLFDACDDDISNVNVPFWRDYYVQVGAKKEVGEDGRMHDGRGILPFRVWQIFDDMVASLKGKDLPRFVAGAGVLAHYVGDSSQPLHASFMHDGDPRHKVKKEHPRSGKPATLVPRGSGVHSAYETKMVSDNRIALLEGMTKRLKTMSAKPVAAVKDGETAAQHVVKEMVHIHKKVLAPLDIIEAFVDDKKTMWDRLGDATIEVMALGTFTLAQLWESAWALGKGDKQFKGADLGTIDPDQVQKIYEDKLKFVPSKSIDHIEAVL